MPIETTTLDELAKHSQTPVTRHRAAGARKDFNRRRKIEKELSEITAFGEGRIDQRYVRSARPWCGRCVAANCEDDTSSVQPGAERSRIDTGRHVLKTLHTIFDGDALVVPLSKAFDLGTIQDCRLWRSFINDVYRVRADGRHWWLRIHPSGWRTSFETVAEIESLRVIARAGGSVASAVQRRNGEYIWEIEAPEGVRSAVLFDDAPGKDLTYVGSSGVENGRRYGEAVARLHDACDAVREFPARNAVDVKAALHLQYVSIDRYVEAADKADLARITCRLLEKLATFENLSVGFCHGDLNSSNVHFAGSVACAIDFDCCAWGLRAFELAAFGRGITWDSEPGDVAERVLQAFYDGYASHRPIEAIDIAAQSTMLLVQRMWVTSLHLNGSNRWGSYCFGNSYAGRFISWLRAWEATVDGPPIRTR